MAKHMVKCLICGESFDANQEEYVKPKANRYAHKKCYENRPKEQLDKDELEAYIKKLFNVDTITYKIGKQIQTYHDEYHYSYSAIRKTLVYFFEIQKNDLGKANGGIGIVPYVIDEASKYWRAIAEAHSLNEGLESYTCPVREIYIQPPQRPSARKLRNLFSFLEMEDE